MDALETLRDMHVAAKAAFQKIDSSPADQRGNLWAKLEPELKLHEQIEERFLYGPMTNDLMSPSGALKDWEMHHEADVHNAEQLISRIEALQPSHDDWLRTVGQLRDALEMHIQKEETQVWPEIRKQWGDDKLQAVAPAIEAAKAAAESGATTADAMQKADAAMR